MVVKDKKKEKFRRQKKINILGISWNKFPTRQIFIYLYESTRPLKQKSNFGGRNDIFQNLIYRKEKWDEMCSYIIKLNWS